MGPEYVLEKKKKKEKKGGNVDAFIKVREIFVRDRFPQIIFFSEHLFFPTDYDRKLKEPLKNASLSVCKKGGWRTL